MSDTTSSSPQESPDQGAPQQDFAATVEQLEALVERLESGALSLEESLTAFEQGVALTREAQKRLDNAELKVRALSEDSDGRLAVSPFNAPDQDAGGEENPPW
ncbi:exodeoxyribonuclease VII small subunit [Halomonas alkaliantarctica]|nr:exodeoxyribonuclease VII small subunit [Halomonas alkaliantarctica]